MASSAPEFRELTLDDGRIVAAFHCATRWSRPWQKIIDEMISGLLSDVDRGTTVLGMFVDGELVALASWTLEDFNTWHVGILAVQHGRWGRKYGTAMKVEVLRRARAALVDAVTSTVHEDNDHMLAINQKLGASMTPSSLGVFGGERHFDCVIVVRRQR